MVTDHVMLLRRLPGQPGSVYYYFGNFYHPLDLKGANVGLVKRLKREFAQSHKALIKSDRAHPDYKTILELFDAA